MKPIISCEKDMGKQQASLSLGCKGRCVINAKEVTIVSSFASSEILFVRTIK